MIARARGWRAAVLLGLLFLVGCAPYALRGRVIDGEYSSIMVVDADDPRLADGRGLPGATVTLQTDPDRINREVVGTAVSGTDGFFETPFSKPGGGFLLYDAGVRVSRHGYRSAEASFALPGASKRLLVVLARGQDPAGPENEDPYEQYRRFRKE